MRRIPIFIFAAFLLGSCYESHRGAGLDAGPRPAGFPLLVVHLISDFDPGREVAFVRVSIPARGVSTEAIITTEIDILRGHNVSGPYLPAGPTEYTVTLLGPSRETVFSVTGNVLVEFPRTVVTIRATR